jgi:hypothetical protein
MRARAHLGSLFVAIILSSGCGGDGDGGTGSRAPSLTGRWVLRYPSLDHNTADLTLVEGQGGTVSGSGVILSNGRSNVTVGGLHNHPNVSLTFDAGNMCTGSFTGTFTDDNTLAGNTIRNRGDCGPTAWTLKRQ